MITTIYKCDHCGHEQHSREQMWDIGIALNHTGDSFGYANRHNLQHWCRRCVEKVGLLPAALTEEEKQRKREEEAKNPPPITLEDIIREIVREEVRGEK